MAKRIALGVKGLGVGLGGRGGVVMTEGPGIDLVGNQVGLGGDTILLYDRGGNPVAEFTADAAGMAAAVAAATAGDVIWLPAYQIGGNHTIPADVEVVGLGVDNSELTGVITNNGTLTHLQVSGTLTNNANLNYVLDPAGNTQATRSLHIQTTIQDARLRLNAGSGGAVGNQNALVELLLNDALEGNITAGEGILGLPLMLNSAVTNPVSLATGGGFVGVRIIAPLSPLHVYENTEGVDATVGLTIEQDGLGDALTQWLLTGGQRWVAGIDNSDGDKWKLASSVDLNTNARLTIRTDGKVGVGITNPDTLLHVHSGSAGAIAAIAGTQVTIEGSADARVQFLSPNDGLNLIYFGDEDDADVGILWYDHSTNKMMFRTNAGTRLTIDPTGKVGVAITAPVSPFHIYENTALAGATVGLTIEQDGAGDAIAQFLLTGGQRWVMGIDNSDNDAFRIASTTDLDTVHRLRITQNTGEVQIPGILSVGASTYVAQLTVEQTSSTIAWPVLSLYQADVDVELMQIVATAQAASADRTLVADSDYGTPGALRGWVKFRVEDLGDRIPDGDYYLPFHAAPT